MGSLVVHPERKTAGASWLRSPQRVWLRRAVFQVHLWLGVVVSLYCGVIGLSGSALVFKEEIERVTEPEVYHVVAGPRVVTLDEAIRRIEADRPGWRVTGLKDFERMDVATAALMGRKDAKPDANYRVVYFNPYNGVVVRDRMRFDGALGWISNLHFYLLAGRTGLLASGWMALALLLLCVSGVLVWWPGVQRWVTALVLRFHRRGRRLNWKRLNWDVHSVVGFWSCTVLLIVTFTGLYFCFPSQVSHLTVLATGGNLARAAAEPEDTEKLPEVSELPVMTVDAAREVARRVLPTEAPAGYMALPSKAGAAYRITGYYRGALPYSQLVSVSLDSRTGKVLRYLDTTKQMRGLRVVQYFFTVHFGSFGGEGWLGVAVKIVWVLLGITPALLAVTGLVMYWNRKLQPLWIRFGSRRLPIIEA